MKLVLSNYLGNYSYSCQVSSELISITVTISCFCRRMQEQEIISLKDSQDLSAITVTRLMVFEVKILTRMVIRNFGIRILRDVLVEASLLEYLQISVIALAHLTVSSDPSSHSHRRLLQLPGAWQHGIRHPHSIRDSRTTTKYSKWHFPAETSLDFPPWGLLKFSGTP